MDDKASPIAETATAFGNRTVSIPFPPPAHLTYLGYVFSLNLGSMGQSYRLLRIIAYRAPLTDLRSSTVQDLVDCSARARSRAAPTYPSRKLPPDGVYF